MQRRLRAPSARALALAAVPCLALIYSLLWLGDDRVETLIVAPNGLVQNAGAVAFLGASVMFGIAFWRTRRLAYVVLALVSFVAAGEEASWGQHALGFDPPDLVEEHNAQGELTLHNLNFIQSIRHDVGFDVALALFIACAFAYMVAVPVLAARSAPSRRALVRRVPVVPAAFGALFLLNLALFAIFGAIDPPDRPHAVTEVAEAGLALVFLAVALDAARPGTGPSADAAE